MRILLTGFGPFGSVVDNPTARIVARFEASGLAGHELVARVLPVSYRRGAQEIARLLAESEIDAAVLLGVAARSSAVRLELFGRNRSSMLRQDSDSQVSAGLVRPGAAAYLPAGASVSGLVRKLKSEGIPARISRTAGDYVCNHTYYAALDYLKREGLATKCLFVHVPPDENTFENPEGKPLLEFEKQVRAVEIILRRVTLVSGSTPAPPSALPES